MRVMIWSAFDRFSGYGNDAVDIARWLDRQGVDVVPFPTWTMPGLPKDFTDLLTKDPRGEYSHLLCFAPPQGVRPSEWPIPPRGRQPATVGWTMWEKCPMVYQDMGKGWGKGRRKGFWTQTGSKPLDLMLVTCRMNIEALQPLDPGLAIEFLPCGIDPEDWPMVARNIDRPMTFGMIGMLGGMGRKDPFTFLDVWREVYEEVPGFDARLKIHSMSPGLMPQMMEWYPNLELTDRAMDRKGLVDWYHSVDVLVSTSRGEGNNKPAMEHQATGGTVIASDWAGHQNWLMPDANYALSGELMFHDEELGIRDFRVSRDHLKELVVHCWQHRAEVAEKGRIASRWMRDGFSWEIITRQLEKRLATI